MARDRRAEILCYPNSLPHSKQILKGRTPRLGGARWPQMKWWRGWADAGQCPGPGLCFLRRIRPGPVARGAEKARSSPVVPGACVWALLASGQEVLLSLPRAGQESRSMGSASRASSQGSPRCCLPTGSRRRLPSLPGKGGARGASRTDHRPNRPHLNPSPP